MGRFIKVTTEFCCDLKMSRFFVFLLLLSVILIEIDACGFGSLGGCGSSCGSSCGGGCGRKKREVII